MRVLKFGGTSVANAERFQDVAKIALDTAAHSQTALVLSAPAKITNLLVALVAQGAAGNSGLKEFDGIKKNLKVTGIKNNGNTTFIYRHNRTATYRWNGSSALRR